MDQNAKSKRFTEGDTAGGELCEERDFKKPWTTY